MTLPTATDADRLAYRLIVWAHGDCIYGCGQGKHPCVGGLPGCWLMDRLMDFNDFGWIDLWGDMP